jgi:hypothetical protein
MSLYEKLHKIQQALKVPKDAVNKFGNYNYRTAESILRAFKDKNEELNLGLALILTDEIVFIQSPSEITRIPDEKDSNSNIKTSGRFYVKATAVLSNGTVTDFENNQIETITASAYAREAENKKGMDEAQVTGAASSYARKYALNGLLAIDDGKDPDSQEPTAEAKPEAKTKPVVNF